MEFRSVTTPCRLDGYPGVTPLDRAGRVLPVPVLREGRGYGHPVALGGTNVATLTLAWYSGWCAVEVDVATLRLDLPERGGTLSVEGFGRGTCGAGSPGEKAPITVGEIKPQEYEPERVVTPYDGIAADVIAPRRVPAGGRLRFLVTLSADHDVAFDPCPDYLITLGETVAHTLTARARRTVTHPAARTCRPVRR